MGQHGSLSTELRLRADDLKHLVRPQYVKGLTRADVAYARPLFGTEPLHGQEILVVVRRFRHHINGSGALLSDNWQALTYDLAAIHGTTSAATALSVYGVTSHMFDRFLDRSPAHGGGGNDATHQLFVLGPGELVRGVDVAWHDRQLVGVRVQTNQRQSPWFGERRGVVKSVTAPQGYFINALERLRTNPNELGLRLCPILDHLARRSAVALELGGHDKSRCVGTPSDRDGTQTEFAAAHDHVRALVVACSAASSSSSSRGITDLHVLSSEMFGRHVAKREEPLPAHEHLFFLRHSEYVTAVEVDVTGTKTACGKSGERIVALRFHTNLTKSAWFGTRDATTNTTTAAKSSSGNDALHVFQVPDKTLQICGFHGTFGHSVLGSLGVFYSAIPASLTLERDQLAKLTAPPPAKPKTIA